MIRHYVKRDHNPSGHVAELDPTTGTVYIDRHAMKKLPVAQRIFILLHEDAHARGVINEFAADAAALHRFLEEGHKVADAVKALKNAKVPEANKTHMADRAEAIELMAQHIKSKNNNHVGKQRYTGISSQFGW